MEPLLNKVNEGSSKEIQLKTEYFNELFGMSSDVKFKKHTITSFGKTDPPPICILIFSEVLVDVKKMWESLERLEGNVLINSKLKEDEVIEDPQDEFKVSRIFPLTTTKEEVEENVFSGMVLMLFEELELLYMFSLPSIPNRSPEETSNEISIRGPRDGFIEDISVNLGLIRKRYKTASLENQSFTIGKRSKTKINLLYVKDVVNPEIIEKVKRKISSINTDVLLGTTELEEFLSGSKFNLVPVFDYTGRPDYTVASLNNGRFAILVDGSPTALIGPGNITFLLKAAEDRHTPSYFTNFEYFFRIIGLLVSIFLPGFYIALISFQLDQLPFSFLATITVSRFGLPLSPQQEAFLILGLFELFREAGITLPRAIGQSLAVVGGLIIGDAAIRGGITSPTMLVVAGTTAVATYTLINQSLGGIVSIARFFILFLSSILGLFGFFLGVFTIVLYLSRLQVYGLPYLAPISPISFKDLLGGGVFDKPYLFKKKRPEMLKTKDKTKGNV
ncbi:spore germination protein [Peribacillus simplex]|uniref:spore germination protein n=1 Tax=Peribacillus simplex TaxID=1478 RepID=UPI000F639369|nr:spore germination protein [Peribacillus simplex]RRN69307.1 spore germination protein [Peribacillus simplex]